VGRITAAVAVDEVPFDFEVPVAVDVDPRRYCLIVDMIRAIAPILIRIRDEARVIAPQLEVFRNAIGDRSVPGECVLLQERESRNSGKMDRPRIAAEFAAQMQIAEHIIGIDYGCLGFLRESVRCPPGQKSPAAHGRLMHPRRAHGQAWRRVVPPQIAPGNPGGSRRSLTSLLQIHIAEAAVFVLGRVAGIRGIRQAAQMLAQGDIAIQVAT